MRASASLAPIWYLSADNGATCRRHAVAHFGLIGKFDFDHLAADAVLHSAAIFVG